ncbi:DUF427 domain-containing protein [Actinoplanes sp. NBRC 101535]|uniref:DUF427 domain-containing protein n=1 Tax=Actinoplanes sp. NBRC 101535 TaxID=3032196 RepID=UPI002556832E|nr:DUF427 domain-containing protein [Actinoplanes sp. NBRC 101535]
MRGRLAFMADKPRLTPGPNHPITVTPSGDHIVVTAGGRVVADTRASLTLQEANYPPVPYIPLSDVDTSLLTRTDTTTWCPYKGEATYYAVTEGRDAVWEYQDPSEAVAAVRGHVAFYPDRVDSIAVTPATS